MYSYALAEQSLPALEVICMSIDGSTSALSFDLKPSAEIIQISFLTQFFGPSVTTSGP